MVMFSPGALQGDPRLGQALRRVRARYALRVLFRGLAILVGGSMLGIAASAYGLDSFRYSREAVLTIRALLYLWIGFLAIRFVGLPVWRGRKQVSNAAIARYIEEHEPSLDAALRSAVDGASQDAGAGEERSTALQSRLVDDVVTRLEAFDLPSQVEESEIRQAAIALGVAAIASLAFFFLAPGFIRQAFPYLFDPFSHEGRTATPYSVSVTPGNHTIARGSDQDIAATLLGFDGAAELVSRHGDTAWVRSPMTREEAAGSVTYRAMMLSVQNPTEYFVESAGTRSDVFRLDVVDKPYVKKVDLEYRFPAYARMEPQKVEGTGDIATLAGTNVIFSITSTVSVTGGRLVVQGKEAAPIPLQMAPGGLALSGEMKITEDGFYKVELQGPDGVFVSASPDYVIEAVKDLPPHIAFERPGRDSQATPIEEVFTEVKAEDDFGVSKVELVYSMNGGPEKVVALHQSPVLKNVVASHTFFLEEMSMKPGDFISYYARANDVGSPSRQATTDIYFLEARPYRKDFRQAEQQGGGGGGGGGDAGSLSQQQRQVIAATFRLVREEASKSGETKTAAQDSQTVALIQGRLRTQVEALIARMGSRGALPEGSPMHGTADELRQAVAKMTEAETELKIPRPKTALPSEQTALAHLQRAEASFRDVQVSFGGGGGGGGGQSNSSAEELADLYELDLDKLRNQYETLQSGAQEQRDEQVDDAMARLQELARRQEQENERARQQGARTPNQGGGGGGGASQRQLADEAEELGRKLERLTRENPSAGLEESARRLKEAATAMRQQASSSRGQSSGSSSKDGQSPLDRLREARRLLDSEKSSRLDRDMSGFQEKAEAIKRAQETIAREMREQATGAPGGEGGASGRAERLRARKDSLASDVAELESRLDKVARDSRREQKETSRKLQDAANGIRDSKLKEKIRYTKGLVDRAAMAEAYENDIAQNIENLTDQLKEAGQSVGVAPEKKKAAALDRARSLAQALDSIGERLKAKGSPGSEEGDQDGQQPGKGQDGRDGQSKAQGDQSRPGQQPGQGKGSQPGQSGEQGQQGQGQQGAQGSQSGQKSRGQGAGSGQSPNGGGEQGEQSGGGMGQQGSSANGGRPGGVGGGGTGRLSAEETRQLRRELGQRGEDAREFQRALQESGISSAQAAALAQRLQALATDRNFKDPLGLADLTRQVADDIKMLEYVLRREAESDRPALQLSGSEDLPPGYRAMVEEYYRTLAKTKKTGK